MKKEKLISVVKDYSSSPYGRYTDEVQRGEQDTTGERFRIEFLVPALRDYQTVRVDLTGYNRYGRSFLDEAFAGLISSGQFTLKELQGRLICTHDDLPSIVVLIQERMSIAEQRRNAH